jgi:hypothetical protein
MQKILVFSAALVCVVSATADDDNPPHNKPPQLWRALATEQDGKVVIQIARPEYDVPRNPVSAEAMKWHDLKGGFAGDRGLVFGVQDKRGLDLFSLLLPF